METEEERRARLENDAVTKRLSLVDRRRKKSKTGEDGSYRTGHVSPEKRCGRCGHGLSLKPILKSWQLCLSFKLDLLTALAPKEI